MEEAASQERYILIVAQRNLQAEAPEPEDIYEVGIVAEIMQMLRVPDGTVRVMLEGIERCRILKYLNTEPYYSVLVEALPTNEVKDLATEAFMRSVVTQFEQVVNISKNIQDLGTVLTAGCRCARNGNYIRTMRCKHLNHPQAQT